jgi:hypothetical protein
MLLYLNIKGNHKEKWVIRTNNSSPLDFSNYGYYSDLAHNIHNKKFLWLINNTSGSIHYYYLMSTFGCFLWFHFINHVPIFVLIFSKKFLNFVENFIELLIMFWLTNKLQKRGRREAEGKTFDSQTNFSRFPSIAVGVMLSYKWLLFALLWLPYKLLLTALHHAVPVFCHINSHFICWLFIASSLACWLFCKIYYFQSVPREE